MTVSKLKSRAGARRARASWAALLTLLLLGALLTTVSSAGAAASAVSLGTADGFAVLAGTGVSSVPTSAITGNVGSSPSSGSTITGLTCAEVTGTIYSVDAAGPLPCRVTDSGLLGTAKSDLTTAYLNAAGQTADSVLVAGDNQLGGQTLVPGVYRFGTATTANLVGNVTLSGGSSDIWIFQATADLVTASSSTVTLSGGAQACNVFWQVSSSATLGSSSSFVGTILALTSISANTSATIQGRLLAQNGLVSLDSNTITRSTCGAAPSTPEPTPAPPREIYCDGEGRAYDLIAGQDTQAPYAGLGLVPAYVDPVTGSKSCAFPVAEPTPTPTPTPTPPTADEQAAAAAAAAAKAAAAKKLAAVQKAAAAKRAAAAKAARATRGFALPAVVQTGFTG